MHLPCCTAKDVADAKVVIKMRKEAHSSVEERRLKLITQLTNFQERRMDFLYDRLYETECILF
jgi:hypothetical protein